MPMIGQVQLRKEIAGRLRQARESAGYQTAEEFCEKHALDIKKYLKHEAGQAAMKSSQAYNYCRLLNVSLFWLMLNDTANPT